MLKKHKLEHSTASNYVQDQIPQSIGQTFALELMALNFDTGEYISTLPDGLDHDVINDLADLKGFFVEYQEPMSTESNMEKRIGYYLMAEGVRYAIFPTPYKLNGVLPITFKPKISFSYQEEVYAYVSKDNYTDKVIQAAFGSAYRYPFICLLTSLPDEVSVLSNDQVIATEIMKQLIKRLDILLVGAYDDVGFVEWHRHGLVSDF